MQILYQIVDYQNDVEIDKACNGQLESPSLKPGPRLNAGCHCGCVSYLLADTHADRVSALESKAVSLTYAV